MIIDAEKVGHEAFRPGTPAWREVVATFGKEVIAPGGEVDRKKLGSIVFGNPEALLKLNRIMHPKMADMMKTRIDEYRRQRVKMVVLDAAILIEANWTPLVEEVWLTVAPESKVLERLKKQRGMTDEQTLARIRSQLSTQERMKYAKVVINNDGDIDELRAKIKELWQKLNSE